MRKNCVIILLSLLLIVAIVVPIVNQRKMRPDITDGLVKVPDNVKKQYGSSRETAIIYNVAALLDAYRKLDARVTALENARVTVLEPVGPPLEVIHSTEVK